MKNTLKKIANKFGYDIKKIKQEDFFPREATNFAVWIGSRWTTRQIPVAIFREVFTAAATNNVRKGSITS